MASCRPTILATDADVLTLRGHSSAVQVCAWKPRTLLLATGSADSTARVWTVPSNISTPSAAGTAATAHPLVLLHGQDFIGQNSRSSLSQIDVTAIGWNTTGTLLATGYHDGSVRIWAEDGQLMQNITAHTGTIFSLKWSKMGNYILTASQDNVAAVWNAITGTVVRKFSSHVAPVLDVDWLNSDTFASCSVDHMIYMHSLDSHYPIRWYDGHEDEVNCLKFDPSGRLLASCSDDQTTRIWSSKSSAMEQCLREHTKEVYTIRWCPNLEPGLVLATASYDALVKLWDVNTGRCTDSLSGHSEAVFTLSYSPDGKFLASGSFDGRLNVWSSTDGSLLKQFRGASGIHEVAWNHNGDKISACFNHNEVCVMDMRKMALTPVKS